MRRYLNVKLTAKVRYFYRKTNRFSKIVPEYLLYKKIVCIFVAVMYQVPVVNNNKTLIILSGTFTEITRRGQTLIIYGFNIHWCVPARTACGGLFLKDMWKAYRTVCDIFNAEVEMELETNYCLISRLDNITMYVFIEYLKDREEWCCKCQFELLSGKKVTITRQYSSELIGATMELNK